MLGENQILKIYFLKEKKYICHIKVRGCNIEA